MTYCLDNFSTHGLPDGMALKAAIRRNGTIVGFVTIQEDGGNTLWCGDSCIGTFDSLDGVYRKLDEREALK